jgi:membrane protease YdiL (CAAX protease family)
MKAFHGPERAAFAERNRQAPRRLLHETVLLLSITFAAQFLHKDLRAIFTFAPLAYFLIEHYLRRRTWAEAGLSFREMPRAVAVTWPLILLVSVIVQFLVVWAATAWLPGFIDHVIARFPFPIGQTADHWGAVVAGTLVGTWIEEVSFRALFQERLSWFMPTPAAIGVVSITFGIGHWTPGDPLIVMVDVLLVIIDSVFYGVIFARSRNVYASWIAHFLANFFAMGFVLLL